jgi:hypothetical protein
MLTVREMIWGVSLALLVFFVGFLWADYEASIPITVPCEQYDERQGHHSATQQCTSYRSIFFPGHAPIIVGAGRFANRNEGAVIGFATILLAIATGFIAWYTFALAAIGRATDRNFREVERAYIFLQRLDTTPAFGFDRGIRAWRVIPVWKNSGTTPARHTVIASGFIERDTQLPETDTLSDVQEPGTTVVAGPAAEIGARGVEFHVVELAHARTRTKWYYLWGWAEYDDVFSTNRHRTEFCYELSVIDDPTINNPRNIVFGVYGRHNGADQECSRQPAPFVSS